ncbi:TetR family transcriptional regulator [Microbacterium marinilacus]|uniref:TetR family transcriptional regulator n=1 Tax=Microbacterium marinilacus TaxID=415209 RepID=A0ABP7BGF0_9MICO
MRERARDAMRTEIAEAMSAIFAERGFDTVTVDEAASEVGISRATFFRYFGSKEDAVLTLVDGRTLDFGAILTGLPTVPGENAWGLLHRTFQEALASIDAASEAERARVRMIQTTPSLRSRLADRRYGHEEALAHALTPHIDPGEAARPIVLAALAVLDLAWRRWAAGETPILRDALDDTFTALDTGSTPIH